MESLWHLTAKEAPQGNIGKLSDEDIALGIDWEGDPEQLVRALVQARWLDESPTFRLIVHDWHEHADDAVDNRVARSILLYANGSMPRMNKLSRQERDHLRARYAPVMRTHAPAVPTREHEKPLPVPEPVPEPVPGPVPASASPFDDEERNIPDDLPPALLGNFLLERLSIPHSYGLAVKFADCVDLLARDEGCPRGEAGRRLLERARDHPPPDGKWRFWLEDGHWKANWHPERKKGPANPADAWTPEATAARERADEALEVDNYAMWNGMSLEFKKANPWKGAVPV